jgi:hypothetical protein
MATIFVNLSVQIPSGPQINVPAQKIEGVEAYEKFEFTLNESEKTQDVTLGEKLVFLLISSDDSEGKSVTYKIGDGDAGDLDAPQVYSQGGIAVLKQPKKLTFELKPDISKPVKVEVLAGYKLEASK